MSFKKRLNDIEDLNEFIIEKIEIKSLDKNIDGSFEILYDKIIPDTPKEVSFECSANLNIKSLNIFGLVITTKKRLANARYTISNIREIKR